MFEKLIVPKISLEDYFKKQLQITRENFTVCPACHSKDIRYYIDANISERARGGEQYETYSAVYAVCFACEKMITDSPGTPIGVITYEGISKF